MKTTAKTLVKVFKKLAEKSGVGFSREVGNRHLVFEDGEFKLKKKESLPEKLQEDDPGTRTSGKHDLDSVSNRESRLKNFRKGMMKGESEGKVAKRAADNHHIMQDVLSDPSMVGAGSETEAVAKVAAENPGWAKMSDLVDAYDIDVDVDGNVEAPGNAEDSGGESGESGESGDSSGDSSISTADPGDLGPSGPSDYGIDTGGSGGESGGEGSSTDIGGSISGGDGGELGGSISGGTGSSGSGDGGDA